MHRADGVAASLPAAVSQLLSSSEIVALEMISVYLNGLIVQRSKSGLDGFAAFQGMSVEDWTGGGEGIFGDRNGILSRHEEDNSFQIDEITARDLNIWSSEGGNGRKMGKLFGGIMKTQCLFDIINHCITSFGKRRLIHWVLNPLKIKSMIESRQRAIAWLGYSSASESPVAALWVEQLRQVLSLARGGEVALSSMRGRGGACLPRRVCKLLKLCAALSKLPLLARQLMNGHGGDLPELLFLQLPFESINVVGVLSEDTVKLLNVDDILQHGNISFTSEFLVSKTKIQLCKTEIDSIKNQLNAALDRLRVRFGIPGLAFKSLSFGSTSGAQEKMDYLIEVRAEDAALMTEIPRGMQRNSVFSTLTAKI